MRSSIFTLILLMVVASPNLCWGGNLTLKLVPSQIPIIIPATGGSFDFRIVISNNDSTATTTDLWALASRPDGSVFGPVWGPVAVTLPPNATIDRRRTQKLPGYFLHNRSINGGQSNFYADWPAGQYLFSLFLGDYPDTVLYMACLNYSVIASDGADSTWKSNAIGWFNLGQTLADSVYTCTSEDFQERPPSPFGPEAAVYFKLSHSATVRFLIFDIKGHLMEISAPRACGTGQNRWQFDGSPFATGIYLYSFLMDDFNACFGKIAIVK
jgi:hypothetical protein